MPAAGRARWARVGLVLAAVWAVCGDAARGGRVAPGLEVAVAGCAAVATGAVCEVGEGRGLTVWLRAEDGARVRVAVDGEVIGGARESVDGGERVGVRVPVGAKRLSITATRGEGRAAFEMGLRERTLAAELVRAEGLRKQKPVEAEGLARPLLDAGDVRTRAAARGIVARIRLSEGKAEAAIEGLREAAALEREAGFPSEVMRDEQALAYACIYQGRRFGEARAALARARAVLAEVPDAAARVPYYEGILAYETGDLRTALRRFRFVEAASLRLSEAAFAAGATMYLAQTYRTLGRDREAEALALAATRDVARMDACTQADVLSDQGWLLARSSGSAERAIELLRGGLAMRAACPNVAAEASTRTDLAWVLLERGDDAGAVRALAEARAVQVEPDGRIAAYWLDIDGQLALRAGRSGEALGRFERMAEVARAVSLPFSSWRAELGRARALEALGRDAEATAAYERAEAIVASSALLVPAEEGRSNFLGRFQKSARAAVAFFRGRDDVKAMWIARRSLARELSALRFIDRLQALGGAERARWDEAVAAYRRERDALSAAAAEAWKLPADELARAVAARRAQEEAMAQELDRAIASVWGEAVPGERPPPRAAAGELVLTYFPQEKGWTVFAETEATVVVRDVGALGASAGGSAVAGAGTGGSTAAGAGASAGGSTVAGAGGSTVAGASAPAGEPASAGAAFGGASASELARALLAPFRDEIAAATRLRIVAAGPLSAVDFHALPWNGGPLIEGLPVAYGIDVGATAAPAATGRALVVSNPRGDLPASAGEARVAVAAVAARGEAAAWLRDEQATYAAVTAALSAGPLALFHYAGHGAFRGRDGWESGLLLSGGGSLSIGDVVALHGAPEHVVLSGCETARTEAAGPVSGLGIAQAFLAAGSRAAIAATRPVKDTLAADVTRALYGGTAPGPLFGGDIVRRYREAVLAVRAGDPAADWASFRVLLP